MTLEIFVDLHREEIDSLIKERCPNCSLDDEEREDWVINDESLYDWALDEGVTDI